MLNVKIGAGDILTEPVFSIVLCPWEDFGDALLIDV